MRPASLLWSIAPGRDARAAGRLASEGASRAWGGVFARLCSSGAVLHCVLLNFESIGPAWWCAGDGAGLARDGMRPSTAYAFGDHYFLLPRNGSEALYNLHDDYMRCGNGLPPGHLEHNSENCCAGGPTALFVGVIRQHFVFRGTTEARPLGDLPTAQGKKAKFVAKDGSGVQYGLFTPLIVRSSENTSTKLKRAMHETLHLCKVLYERGTSRLEVGGPESGPAGFENDAQCLHVLRPYVEHRATTMVAEQATMVAEQAPWWQSPWLG